MDFSPSKAWSRTFEKYSPTRCIKHSPVISSQGKVLPLEFVKDRAQIITWLTTTTEEFYYHNIIELMSIYEKGVVGIDILLRRNRIRKYWPHVLTNFHSIGRGGFGEVYKATDRKTNQVYAIKQIKENHNSYSRTIIDLLLERNAYVRANESPFVVRLYGAFQRLKSNWMVLEFCIGDLKKYIDAIYVSPSTFMDNLLDANVTTKLNASYMALLSLDVETTAFIYSFELLAGLDYLATRNLIHRDLKPENILVSVTGHLKIADLGLTQRLRWIDRRTIVEMVDPSDFKRLEKKDDELPYSGNKQYSDPETIIQYELSTSSAKIYANIDSPEFPITNGSQDFLSDLYSAAIIIMELLFFGMNFITPDSLSAAVAKEYGIRTTSRKDMTFFRIRCIYDDNVRSKYLHNILNKQTTLDNIDVVRFLKSSFLPKKYRGLIYTKSKNYYQYKRKIRGRCLDITKIEAMDLYKMKHITTFTVNQMPISATVFGFYANVYSDENGATFKEFELKINRDHTDKVGIPIRSFEYAE